MERLPSVLVVSHQPFDDHNSNGKTISNFFEGWPTDSVANLFFTFDTPSFSVCRNFFRLTDWDALRRFFGHPSNAGVVAPRNADEGVSTQRRLKGTKFYRVVHKLVSARIPSALLARSAAWQKRVWWRDDLRRWLDDVDPDLVFFQSSNCEYAFRVVAQICSDRQIPLVMETTDDYVTPIPTKDPLGPLYFSRLERVYRDTVNHSLGVIAIGDKMAAEYKRRFGGRYWVAMNAVEEVAPEPLPEPPAGTARVVYAGNIGLKRWQTLVAVAQALDMLAAEGLDATLDIYSLMELDPEQAAAFAACPRLRFLGGVSSDELADIRRDATLLLHVESFDERMRGTTRLSVSTKIPEALASGRTLMGVGPADVASIEYLVDQEVAFVATEPTPEAILPLLRRALTDIDYRRTLAERGLDLVQRRHLRKYARAIMRSIAASVPQGE